MPLRFFSTKYATIKCLFIIPQQTFTPQRTCLLLRYNLSHGDLNYFNNPIMIVMVINLFI